MNESLIFGILWFFAGGGGGSDWDAEPLNESAICDEVMPVGWESCCGAEGGCGGGAPV
jgi:hypothetical protein